MTRRLIIDKDKLLISKSGFDVFDPNLEDENKIFDSRWPFAFGVLQKGYYAGNEAPPSSAPFVTQHFFGEREARPLLITEIVTRDGQGGVGGSGSYANPDSDNISYGFSGFYKRGIDSVFNSNNSQTIKMFTNRFEVTWVGYTASNRTVAFSWFILALPAGEQ